MARASVPLITLGTLATGVAMAAAPSLPVQIGVVATAAAFAACVVLARARKVLYPAWVIVAILYLIGPIGAVFSQSDTEGSAVAAILLGLVPFAVAGAFVRPAGIRRLPLLAPLLLLLLLAAASLTWSPSAGVGSSKLILWVLTGLVPAALILILGGGSERISWALILIAAFVTAVASLLFIDDSYPPTLFNINPIWASRAAFIGVLVAVFGPFPLTVKLLSAPVMFASGLITISLGPLVGLAVGAIAGAVEALRGQAELDRRVALGWAAVGLTIGLSAIALLAGLADPWIAEVGNDPNVSARRDYLRAVGPLFVDSPLFGVGLGGFAATGLDDYPHNLPAEIASELGFVGLVLLVGWTVIALRAAAGSPLLVALVVATGAFSVFSGHIGSNNEFWLFTALALAMPRTNRWRPDAMSA